MCALQATKTASVPKYSYTCNVPSAAPARKQLPLMPLPPANRSSVLSPLYGRPSGVVEFWDDGATGWWDLSHSLATAPSPLPLSLALISRRLDHDNPIPYVMYGS
jgi:hypothetical protein